MLWAFCWLLALWLAFGTFTCSSPGLYLFFWTSSLSRKVFIVCVMLSFSCMYTSDQYPVPNQTWLIPEHWSPVPNQTHGYFRNTAGLIWSTYLYQVSVRCTNTSSPGFSLVKYLWLSRTTSGPFSQSIQLPAKPMTEGTLETIRENVCPVLHFRRNINKLVSNFRMLK